MENLKISATERTPEVEFDFERSHLRIKGESYPENFTAFYGPVLSSLDQYLEILGQGTCRVDFELIYFNSSSAKVIMTMFDKLENAAKNGASISVYWNYDEEDDMMEELGEEFGEDLNHADFHMKKI
jgi:hypothetical protein